LSIGYNKSKTPYRAMNKKDIEKILKQGSARQRAQLLAEDTAHYRIHHKSFLSENLIKALNHNFKTSAEIAWLNKFRAGEKVVINAMGYLKQLQLAYEVSTAYLTGYCLLWDQYQREEELLNRLLVTVKIEEHAKAITGELTSGASDPLLGHIKWVRKGLKEGEIQIQTRELPPRKLTREIANKGGYGIEDLIDIYSQKVTEELLEAKALGLAILEYMKEEKFTIKPYRDTVKDILKDLRRDRAVIPKFSKKLGGKLTKNLNKTQGKQTEDLMSKYWVFADPDAEPPRERIDWYKNVFIRD